MPSEYFDGKNRRVGITEGACDLFLGLKRGEVLPLPMTLSLPITRQPHIQHGVSGKLGNIRLSEGGVQGVRGHAVIAEVNRIPVTDCIFEVHRETELFLAKE